MSRGELWNVLPYSGVWGKYPVCGLQNEFKIPTVKKTILTGVPFAGDNTGENPDLKLITFDADTSDGPIIETGIFNTFIDELLDYEISWKVEPLEPGIKSVLIGFYSPNYLNRNLGPDAMLFIIGADGPAFFEANRCNNFSGRFEATQFLKMYVVVDANVRVLMKVTFKVPKCLVIPCFDKLFKRHKYCSKKCGLIATEQLIDFDNQTTLLRPVDKYIELSQEMIAFLFKKAVTITIFEPVSLNMPLLQTSRIVDYGSVQAHRTTGTANYTMDTKLAPGKNTSRWALTLYPDLAAKENHYRVHYDISISIDPNSGLANYPFLIEAGLCAQTKWNGFEETLLRSTTPQGATAHFVGVLEPKGYPSAVSVKVGFDNALSIVLGILGTPRVKFESIKIEYYSS